ncbi:MAG: hypothetical protein AB9828_10535 [Sphaerochaetaceae bacterium]
MMDCMLIPTYWSTRDILSWKIFDHPTPIEEEGTLGRTLDNLQSVSYPDPIILFPAPSDIAIEEKVRQIARNRPLDIRIVTISDIQSIRDRLQACGFPDTLLPSIGMDSYGGVRNMGLLYAVINGFENVIMIDDDECIDRNYHYNALQYLGGSFNGDEILGKTGCVLDAGGHKYYDGQDTHGFENWPKDVLFNENVKKELEASEILSKCTVAFGGNMAIHRKMFLQVPFDPYGTRGEDDDYVLNARYCGFPFFFDQDLLLLHLPPQRTGGYWTRHRQDILRFKYTREKVRLFGFQPGSLGTFLEYFTQDDLEFKAVSSSISAAKRFMDLDRGEFNEFLQNAILATYPTASQTRTHARTFLQFMEAWQTVVPRLLD